MLTQTKLIRQIIEKAGHIAAETAEKAVDGPPTNRKRIPNDRHQASSDYQADSLDRIPKVKPSHCVKTITQKPGTASIPITSVKLKRHVETGLFEHRARVSPGKESEKAYSDVTGTPGRLRVKLELGYSFILEGYCTTPKLTPSVPVDVNRKMQVDANL